MITVCPKCELALAVSASDLRTAGGHVRCGRCAAVFNALAALYDDSVLGGAAADPDAGPGTPASAPGAAATRVHGAHRETLGPTLDFELPEEPATPIAASVPSVVDAVTTAAPAAVPEPPAAEAAAPLGDDMDTMDLAALISPREQRSREAQAEPAATEFGSAAMQPAAARAAAASAATPRVQVDSTPRLETSLGSHDASAPRAGLAAPLHAEGATAAVLDGELDPIHIDSESIEEVTVLRADAALAERVPQESLPSRAQEVDPGTAARAPLHSDDDAASEPDARSDLDADAHEIETEEEAAPEDAQRRRWALAAALLAVTLVVQIVHRNRAELATTPAFERALTGLYGVFGARVIPHWDLGDYELRQNGVFADAEARGALQLRASIHNRGAAPLPAPLLRVVLEDRFANRIAARDLEPAEYLGGGGAAARARIAPGRRVDASIALADPGGNAVGFVLDVCLPRTGGGVECANAP